MSTDAKVLLDKLVGYAGERALTSRETQTTRDLLNELKWDEGNWNPRRQKKDAKRYRAGLLRHHRKLKGELAILEGLISQTRQQLEDDRFHKNNESTPLHRRIPSRETH